MFDLITEREKQHPGCGHPGATVGEDGDVMEVRLLRSANPLLDREAERAVRQWRYSPVVLNGIRVPFILTVTLSFHLEAPK